MASIICQALLRGGHRARAPGAHGVRGQGPQGGPVQAVNLISTLNETSLAIGLQIQRRRVLLCDMITLCFIDSAWFRYLEL